MSGGQLAQRAHTKAVFGNLKMPYTEALLQSIPKIEDPSHTRLMAIGGRPPDLVNPPRGCRVAPRCPYAVAEGESEWPPLDPAESPGHFFRCWYPVGSPEYLESKERNEQLAAAGAP